MFASFFYLLLETKQAIDTIDGSRTALFQCSPVVQGPSTRILILNTTFLRQSIANKQKLNPLLRHSTSTHICIHI